MENLETLEKNAIDAAIKGQWDEAIALNEQIIKQDKKNIEAYLRLGFAFMQKGDLKKAKTAYLKAKKIQPENFIIDKNLEKIKVLEAKKNKPYTTSTLSPYAFLDIPGKTKSITLVNPGQKSVLAGLSIGQEVFLNIKKRRIEVRTSKKEFIGYLPDDISKRLTILIKAGSNFKCYVKEADLKNVVIFVKEEKRGKKVSRYSPFPINNVFTGEINTNEEGSESDSEEISDSDLEMLAESLTSEEKDYLPFQPTDEENEEEEE
ncbi:MAG: hypothetical protein Fur009_7530 [Candidatus Microgenomates bacterium]